MLKPLATALALLAPAAAPPPPPPEANAAAPRAPAPLHRGEKFTGAPRATLAEVVTRPEAFAGKTVTLEATVRKACTNKGCWLELADGADPAAPAVRVTFKNYGFFVPLDSAGSTALVEGQVKVAELTEAKAKHWEGEGATVPRGADGKPREVQLVASAVELRRSR